MGQCTAKSKRTGERCRRAAMHGQTVCYMHGGASRRKGGAPKGSKNALKTGQYETILASTMTPEELSYRDSLDINPLRRSGKPSRPCECGSCVFCAGSRRRWTPRRLPECPPESRAWTCRDCQGLLPLQQPAGPQTHPLHGQPARRRALVGQTVLHRSRPVLHAHHGRRGQQAGIHPRHHLRQQAPHRGGPEVPPSSGIHHGRQPAARMAQRRLERSRRGVLRGRMVA